ncbi:methyltransferase family protein [Novosphingobium sp. PhB165]|uniref:class I SAM-dependent methyltransferase n=1 Tax=Novosphingobium sp. PhB165 TaxID=2485105 RepID=UPI001047D21A|nr:methyltransferase domain-containing protein [Novosphingobium sp. PhB165]TCM15323.1 methyltransferase family protein [Novosphingobium sp. PhB165]
MPDEQNHHERVIGQFSLQAASYGKLTCSMASDDRRAAFAALVGAMPDDIALDVCCGPGSLALDLAPFVSHVTGLDLTPAMLDQARAAQASRGIANAEWVVGDAFRMPFPDAAFTLVTCSAAFHHMRDPRLALTEMARVCRAGGRIVVRDVTPEEAKSAAYDRMERLRDPSHVHALTAAELAHLGEGLGLDDPRLHGSITPDLPFDAVLGTSFPDECSIADLRTMFQTDAEEGQDRLGFSARIVDGVLCVSYRQTTAIWIRP